MDVFLVDSWDLNEKDKQINFFSHAVPISGEIVPFEQIYQTRCLGMLILLISFFRQLVTILGEHVPLE